MMSLCDQLERKSEQLKSVFEQRKRYGVSANLICIAELLLVLTTAVLIEQEAELG